MIGGISHGHPSSATGGEAFTATLAVAVAGGGVGNVAMVSLRSGVLPPHATAAAIITRAFRIEQSYHRAMMTKPCAHLTEVCSW
jgi:hypothetical protein